MPQALDAPGENSGHMVLLEALTIAYSYLSLSPVEFAPYWTHSRLSRLATMQESAADACPELNVRL
jgi:hypothetical protein